MKQLALSLALLVALAASAGATTYNVGGGVPLSFAFQNANGGDIINVATGTYSRDSIKTTKSGSSGACIMVLGNVTTPASVAITGGNLATTKSYVQYRGFNVTGGGLDVSGGADSLYFVSCKFDSGASFAGISIYGADATLDTTQTCVGITVQDCTFNVGTVPTLSYAWLLKDAAGCVFTRVRVLRARSLSGVVDSKGRYFFKGRRNTFTDCRFDFDSEGSEGGESHAIGYRDYSYANTFLRDTLRFGMNSGVTRAIYMTQSGSAFPTTPYFSYTSCDYRTVGGTFVWQNYMDSTTVQGCLFASRNDPAVSIPGAINSMIRNNTFYSRYLHTIDFDQSGAHNNITSTTIHKNLFASPVSAAACNKWDSSGVFVANYVEAMGSDSNYFSPADTSKTTGNSQGTNSCRTLSSWVTGSGNDPHSKSSNFSSSMFKDTTWATLNLRPLTPTSPLLTTFSGGNYIGAYSDTGAVSGGAGPWTITASAGSGGSISPSGAVSVADGASQAFTITPATNYHVWDVLVDGASVGAVTSYTFSSVTASHTISCTFATTDPIITPGRQLINATCNCPH